MADDVAAVVTEALANVVRHAGAQEASVTVSAANGHLSVDVVDDGKGLDSESGLSGLINLRDRALQRDGGFSVTNAKPAGTHLSWWIPV